MINNDQNSKMFTVFPQNEGKRKIILNVQRYIDYHTELITKYY